MTIGHNDLDTRKPIPLFEGIIRQDRQGTISYASDDTHNILGSQGDLESLTAIWQSLRTADGQILCGQRHPVQKSLSDGRSHFCFAYLPVTEELQGTPSLYIRSFPVDDQIYSTVTDTQGFYQQAPFPQNQLRQLEAIEKISRISLEAEDVDQMLHESLGALLDIFNCDRASLVYPCNPEANTITIPMERTRPEWPGAVAMNVDLPVDESVASALEAVLNTSLPVRYGPQSPNPLPQPTSDHFHIKSQMMTALYPKVDQPWALVIHHCQYPHVFTEEEVWLYHEISQRIGNSLTSLITLRNLRESEEQFRTLVQHAPEAIFVLDIESRRIIEANDNAARLFKLRPDELIGYDYLKLSPCTQPNGLDSGQAAYEYLRAAAEGATPVYEWIYLDNNGQHICCETRLVRLPAAKQTLIRGSITDITQRKQSEAHMRQLSMALEQTADAVIITDSEGKIEYVNAAFESVTGYSRTEAIGQTPAILKSDEQTADDPKYQSQLWHTIKAGKVFNDIIINRRKDGSLYYEEKTITPLKSDDGTITHYISTGRDISDRMQTQEYLQFLAHHDTLTQLPNRSLFIDRLQQAIQHAQRDKTRVAVIFADLDRFKIINDTLGHEAGDQVLRTAAERFSSVLRSSDTVSRQGGDEFTILLTDITHIDQVAHICKKLLTTLTQPIHINEQELFLSSSLGISTYPEDGTDPRTLIKHADIAMYRAKESGRNNYQFFSLDMSDKAVKRLRLETDLRRALARNEFVLHYQPQLSLSTGELVGFEALLRWQPPEAELVSPLDFIPILEDTGLIIGVGEWVLSTACQQLHAWHQINPMLSVSVNVSNRQFNDHKLEENFKRIIKDSGLNPQRLDLELTESLLMINPARTEDILTSFGKIGISLSIDDFGTGYSSLSYLRRFPLDTLKIDRSFVRDITTDADDAALISAIISMAKSLHLSVTAEGIETEEQLNFLKRLNCETAQGFLFYKPMPADEAEALIRQKA